MECGLLYVRLTPTATKLCVAAKFSNVPNSDLGSDAADGNNLGALSSKGVAFSNVPLSPPLGRFTAIKGKDFCYGNQ